MNNDVIGVIVIGGHIQGLGIARAYGRNSIPCIVLDDTKHNLARHSKYSQAFYLYPKGELLEFLLCLKSRNMYKYWLLLPTNDLHVAILSKNKDLLNNHFVVSSDDWDTVLKCYNKRITYSIAQSLDIQIPKTWMPNSIAEVNELELPYPCIIKPAIMHTFYESVGKKVCICNSRKELLQNYVDVVKIIPPNEVIIQEIIPGFVNNQFSACFLFNRSQALVSISALRRRQHPISFGHATTYAETVHNNEVIEYAMKILKYLGYKGICEVEFMYDERDNKYKFLEINPRTWKWHSIAEKANTPFLLYLYDLLIKNEVLIANGWQDAAFRHFLTDFPIVLKMIAKRIYTKPLKLPIQPAVWDFSDPLPSLFELLYLPYNIFHR